MHFCVVYMDHKIKPLWVNRSSHAVIVLKARATSPRACMYFCLPHWSSVETTIDSRGILLEIEALHFGHFTVQYKNVGWELVRLLLPQMLQSTRSSSESS